MALIDRDVVALVDDALYSKLHGFLQRRGWKLRRAADTEELADLFEHQDFHAGLLQLQRLGNGKLFDLVGRQQSMQWIALMDHSFWQPTPQHRNFLAGVYDFHTLPVDQDRLSISLGHAWGKGQMLKSPVSRPDTLEHHGIVGSSPAMQSFCQMLRKASKVDAPVLIGGESGTGKELAARAIHNMSARSKHAFVAVNCGAIPSTLLEMFDEITKPTIDLETLLHTYMTESFFNKESDFSHPNRSFVHQELYLPGYRYDKSRLNLCILVDRSMSITDEVFARFLGIIDGIVRLSHDFEVSVVPFDERVYSEETKRYDAQSILPDISIAKGNGGTAFGPVAEYLNRHVGEKNLAIILSDGHFVIENPPRMQTLFVLSEKSNLERFAPFGDVVYFDQM